MSAELRDQDVEIFAKELENFVPERIYDVHAHMYNSSTWQDFASFKTASPEAVTMEEYRKDIAMLLPRREVHAMHFPFPVYYKDDTGMAQDNEWVSREIKKDSLARGQFLVKPTDDPEWVRQEVRRLGLRGLKPYCFYSSVENIWEAEIPDFLPEPLVAVANEEGWSITLHMMHFGGCTDASNQHYIRHYCEKYPNMQLILDHCARGFNPYHVVSGLSALTGLDNLWVDTSMVCSPFSIEAVFRIIGLERTLYASDYCTSHYRGVNFGVVNTFKWLYEETPVWDSNPWSPDIKLLLIGMENLLAIKAACWSLGFTDSQVEKFFWGNAANLLGIE